MARTLVNGAVLSIASTYGADKTMSALSNAAEGVATLEASHGVIVGDIVVVESGWQRLDGRVARAGAVATNDVTLEDINTSNTDRFPAGSGTGTVKEVTAWTQVGQLLSIASSGGDQQFLTYQYVDQDMQSQVPTVQTPVTVTLELHDDISSSTYTALKAAMDSGEPYAFRLALRDGKKIYGNAYVTVGAMPILESNNIVRRQVTLSLVAEVTQYAS